MDKQRIQELQEEMRQRGWEILDPDRLAGFQLDEPHCGGFEIVIEHDLESGEIRDIRCQMIIRVPWTGTVPNLQAVKEHLQAALVEENLEQAAEHLDKATKG